MDFRRSKESFLGLARRHKDRQTGSKSVIEGWGNNQTFKNITGVKDVEIYSVLGKLVYKNTTNSGNINIAKNNNMLSNLFYIKLWRI